KAGGRVVLAARSRSGDLAVVDQQVGVLLMLRGVVAGRARVRRGVPAGDRREREADRDCRESASAPPSDARRLLARDHSARRRVLSRTHSFVYGCSLRPCIAWCSRPRSGAASLEGALLLRK